MSQIKISREVSQEILIAVEQLRLGSGFGSIEIVLHEGHVTQIEKREKCALHTAVRVRHLLVANLQSHHFKYSFL
ncbi:MAG: YezD family protein [Methylophilaceae bacterium]|nr:YezD family protein [Methylophilaceae bacterium]